MTLTPRQMLILFALIVGFGVAAVLVSRDDARTREFDQAAWCSGADVLAGLGPTFRGETADSTVEDLETAQQALFAIETAAPFELWSGIGRLADFAIIVKQARGDSEWPQAFAAARDDVETDLVDQALEDLSVEMSSCGLQLG